MIKIIKIKSRTVKVLKHINLSTVPVFDRRPRPYGRQKKKKKQIHKNN